jgi:hypothetical protein
MARLQVIAMASVNCQAEREWRSSLALQQFVVAH